MLVPVGPAPNPNEVVDAGADEGVDVTAVKAGFAPKAPTVGWGAGLDFPELVPAR